MLLFFVLDRAISSCSCYFFGVLLFVFVLFAFVVRVRALARVLSY